MGIKIVADSSCDVGLEYLAENKDIIHIEPCYVTLGDKDFLDDFGAVTDIDAFYKSIRAGVKAQTAMVTPARFEAIYKEMVEENHEIIYLGFSSKLSSVHSSSIKARENILEIYPDAKIYIIDTLCASSGLSLAMHICIDMIRAGHSATEVVEYIKNNRQKINHWFAVDDLKFLKAGGRISPSVALIGTTFNIKPILTVDSGGHIVSAGKTRGRKKSIALLAEKARTLHNPEDSDYIFISHADCEQDALELKAQVQALYPKAQIWLRPLSMTIATHVGPGALVIAFMGQARKVDN